MIVNNFAILLSAILLISSNLFSAHFYLLTEDLLLRNSPELEKIEFARQSDRNRYQIFWRWSQPVFNALLCNQGEYCGNNSAYYKNNLGNSGSGLYCAGLPTSSCRFGPEPMEVIVDTFKVQSSQIVKDKYPDYLKYYCLKAYENIYFRPMYGHSQDDNHLKTEPNFRNGLANRIISSRKRDFLWVVLPNTAHCMHHFDSRKNPWKSRFAFNIRFNRLDFQEIPPSLCPTQAKIKVLAIKTSKASSHHPLFRADLIASTANETKDKASFLGSSYKRENYELYRDAYKKAPYFSERRILLNRVKKLYKYGPDADMVWKLKSKGSRLSLEEINQRFNAIDPRALAGKEGNLMDEEAILGEWDNLSSCQLQPLNFSQIRPHSSIPTPSKQDRESFCNCLKKPLQKIAKFWDGIDG